MYHIVNIHSFTHYSYVPLYSLVLRTTDTLNYNNTHDIDQNVE